MIAYLGLSHLSLCYSAAALIKGYNVTIIDFKKNVENYLSGKFNVNEPKLNSIFNKNKKKILISHDFNYLKKAKIIFLAKDLKTNKKNKIETQEIIELLRKIGELRKKKILVIKSQVPVGFTRKLNWKRSLKFHYVETLVFGEAVDRALYPERIILGKQDNKTKLPSALSHYIKKFFCPILEMNFEESELTKGFINTYLASQVITTNYLNEFSKKYQADWQKIKNALQLDKRIGKFAYLNPGLGLSGGNVERDLKTISDTRRSLKLHSNLTDLYLKNSNYYKEWPLRIIKQKCNNKSKIGILGYTYKENTLSSKNSPSKLLLKFNYFLHDIHEENLKKLKENKRLKFSQLEDILKKSSLICIFHNLRIYRKINFNKYPNIKIILDPYSFLKENKISIKSNYFNL
jgi:UDPglucose 6-dehydrogenase